MKKMTRTWRPHALQQIKNLVQLVVDITHHPNTTIVVHIDFEAIGLFVEDLGCRHCTTIQYQHRKHQQILEATKYRDDQSNVVAQDSHHSMLNAPCQGQFISISNGDSGVIGMNNRVTTQSMPLQSDLKVVQHGPQKQHGSHKHSLSISLLTQI